MSTLSIKPTTLESIKRLAKDIRKRDGITHAAALDIAARQAGYSNYQHAHRAIGVASAEPEFTHRAFIEVPWRPNGTKVWSWEGIEVRLPMPLVKVLDFPQWKQAHGMYGMDQSGTDRLVYRFMSSKTADDALRTACAAARALQFMAATGLRPSKARGKDAPRQPRNSYTYRDLRIPGTDHGSIWYDPATKTHVALDEPYSSSIDHRQEERAAWAEEYGWEVVKPSWDGMYAPDLGSEMYLMADRSKGFPMARLVKALEALAPAIVPENCCKVESGLPKKG